MPTLHENVSLKSFNTFGIESRARYFVQCASTAEVTAAVDQAAGRGWPRLVLGGGSNLLLTRDFPGLVMHMSNRGIALVETRADAFVVRAAAGESWHGLVLHTLDAGWNGLENLALIPGTVGAAPLQNIGAYGVELESVFESLDALDTQTGAVVTLKREACGFAYRDSIFKGVARDRYVILEVSLRLPRNKPPVIDYADLRAWFARLGVSQPDAREVCAAVVAIRRAKLPDPAVAGNAGSFFKNPLVAADKFAALKVFYPDLPGYAQPGGAVKLAAGWLIDHAGWKGRTLGGAAVSQTQALVLVNRGGAVAADVLALAQAIQADIRARFGVELIPEPVLV